MKNNRLGKIDFSALNVPPEKLYEKSIKSKLLIITRDGRLLTIKGGFVKM